MIEKKTVDWEIFKRVIGLSRPFIRIFALTGVLAVVLAPLGVARPFLINKMVDQYIMRFDAEGLLRLTVLLMGILLLTGVIRYFFIYTTNLLGQNIIKDLRVKVFSHMTRLQMRYFDTTPVGKSTTRTISDIEAINTVFSQGIITMIADLLQVVAVLIIMMMTSWRLTLICLITMPLMILATYIFKEKVKSSFQVVRTQISNMNAFLQERISGMRIVQIFNAEKQEAQKFKDINRSYTKANLNAILYYAIFFPVVEIIHFGTIALMVWWGARGYLEGHITLGSLIAFPIYLGMLFRPIRMLADKFNTLQMGLIAAERVFLVLDSKELIKDDGSDLENPLKGKVEFVDVNFSYDGTHDVLHDIDFSIEPEETLAIVGSTGSGKSTIINLLYRFYDLKSGRILIDDIPIHEISLNDLRSNLGLVLQDIFLFSGSVLDNITLKNNKVSIEDVLLASKLIGAHDQFRGLPGGYNFNVMERGENLSMGQRQLISFVRALVYNPKILILDEATSSIDTETESVIQHAIEKLIDKRTSIVIAHRLSTIKHANRILVLDKGRIVEYGSHDELITYPKGYYRKMYELQFETEEAYL